MTGHEKATSLELAGRPEVALSQQKYHSIIHIQKRPDELFKQIGSHQKALFFILQQKKFTFVGNVGNMSESVIRLVRRTTTCN